MVYKIEEVTDEMMRAIDIDDLEWMRSLLKAGYPVDKLTLTHFGSITPFYRACEVGSVEACAVLLDAGADINFKAALGRTGLHDAVSSRNVEMIQFLLSRHALVDVEDDAGKTALALAIDDSNLELVKLLTQGGARPDFVPKAGQYTPFENSLYVDPRVATRRPDEVGERMDVVAYLVLECGMSPDLDAPVAIGGEGLGSVRDLASPCMHPLMNSLKAEVAIRRAMLPEPAGIIELSAKRLSSRSFEPI